MVERDRATLAELERSCEALAAGEVEIIGADAFAWLQGARERFDVVFLDPPFRQNALPALLESVAPL
jgi:16S rRNA (guanine966-N2)-methyltransferase